MAEMPYFTSAATSRQLLEVILEEMDRKGVKNEFTEGIFPR
jgi:hypothetical protein